ncbi:hypothetical protein LQE92_01335 [Lacrimispora sp. NSJ-141]|uniref:Uncharacterized protein n=1 Tax=Lientehia hominis TaxID=2897778 RepID=A0AAP2RGN4_9FIRM|nr:hypothetical protein [Lientehia hominis]MCD2491270.1 hypothetical protein [Lientehia hominis]
MMTHKIINTIGLGILGVDPFTAVYLLSMGLRQEKKSNITLFFLSYAGFSVLIGAVLSAIFGTAAVDILKNMVPGDNSPFWAVLEFAVSVFILVWVLRKLFGVHNKKEEKEKKAVDGTWIKSLSTGFVFAISCFTDPTYYAVILLGGEAGNFLTATLLLMIWFIVSQFMALIVYAANSLNLLDKLVAFVDKLKEKKIKPITYILYTILVIIAIVLLVDTGFYLFDGRYLF